MPKTITLEVTERQAAALLVADHLGKIQLRAAGTAAGSGRGTGTGTDRLGIRCVDGSPGGPVAATLPVSGGTTTTINVTRAGKVERLCQTGGSFVPCQQEEQ